MVFKVKKSGTFEQKLCTYVTAHTINNIIILIITLQTYFQPNSHSSLNEKNGVILT